MTGREFVRRVRRLARKRGLTVRLDPSAGKGDHATLYLNGRKTIVADMHKDIPRGTFHNMCRQLGIDPKSEEAMADGCVSGAIHPRSRRRLQRHVSGSA